MSYRAIYTYAWDLAEEGIAGVGATQFRALGLDTVTVGPEAITSGKFLRPHGRTGKVYFPEHGMVYFKTTPSYYKTIKPVANSIVSSIRRS